MTGTNQREQVYVYGSCSSCSDTNVLVYELDNILICAEHYRRKTRLIKRTPPCDKCGPENAVRDPSHKRDEYLCWSCREDQTKA